MNAADSGSPTAMMRRRPDVSARRPPAIRPSPDGVAVASVKRAIVVAVKPRTSLR